MGAGRDDICSLRVLVVESVFRAVVAVGSLGFMAEADFWGGGGGGGFFVKKEVRDC
jgi:hypothetical protein